MHTHALAPVRSLAFTLLVLSSPSAFASDESGVTVTEHALPPQEGGTLPAVTLRAPRVQRDEDRAPWSRVDLSLAGSYAVLAGLDAYQTANLPPGYREGNPLVSSWAGERPRFEHAVAFKALTTWGALTLVNRLEHPGRRRVVLVLMNVIQASVVVLNERKTGGILMP